MARPTIARIGEISLIREIQARCCKNVKDVLVGIGDDAAVLTPPHGFLLATTDMMVEGIHFDLRFITAYQLGFKLISVNVSDIFAMGGTPHYILLNIAVRKNTLLEFIHELLQGVKDAMTRYRAVLVGGDVSATKSGISLSATIIGSARKYIRRSGARTGDGIYVTGTLGDSACGLAVLKKLKKPIPIQIARRPSSMRALRFNRGVRITGTACPALSWNVVEPLIKKHVLPIARNPRRFAHSVTAMIDVSDGLLIDLARLCDESGTGAKIFEDRIPISAGARETAKLCGVNPVKLALTGGEDYELLFTAPKGANVRATCIGEITDSKRVIVGPRGTERPFSSEGYQHFN